MNTLTWAWCLTSLGLFMCLVHWYMIGFLFLVAAGLLFGLCLKAKVIPKVQNVSDDGHTLSKQG